MQLLMRILILKAPFHSTYKKAIRHLGLILFMVHLEVKEVIFLNQLVNLDNGLSETLSASIKILIMVTLLLTHMLRTNLKVAKAMA